MPLHYTLDITIFILHSRILRSHDFLFPIPLLPAIFPIMKEDGEDVCEGGNTTLKLHQESCGKGKLMTGKNGRKWGRPMKGQTITGVMIIKAVKVIIVISYSYNNNKSVITNV